MQMPTEKQANTDGFMQIEPMLVASTAHVTQEEAEALNRGTHEVEPTFTREEGWQFYIPMNFDEDIHRQEGGFPMSDGFRGLVERAKELGCGWLMIDRDADTLDGIPTQSW